jgi:outer membrane protein assembly factor BamD (BamD/ComL family)
MILKRKLSLAFAMAVSAALIALADQPNITPGPGVRYATDAFPGFDSEDNIVNPEKKEPKWFAFINGPKMSNPADQLDWARQCEASGSYGRARRAYDALVREWPISPEAPVAQKAMADVLLNHELNYEDAFAEYRYLLDFYSLDCDYGAVAELMYKVAELMREEGKTIIFFRFANTVDVRRAYEAVVLRSPGSPFVPQAMLTIASLREDEQKYEDAVKVYENLRNIHPEKPEARTALHREAMVRMKLLDMHGYNRTRVLDTASFLRQALRGDLPADMKADFEKWLDETSALEESEAYNAARFYDSRTRTRRSAINAYERFLKEYPTSAHADEVRARLEVLKEEGSVK